MRILEYRGLDTTGVAAQYDKVRRHLEQEDFRAAQVKKLAPHGLYRARLDDANRLLFKLATYRGERCALILEVIPGHAYERSRFLRGAPIDEAKIPDFEPSGPGDEPPAELPYLNPSNPRFHLLDKVLSFDARQEEIFHLSPPLIIIGPAGSGKTALTLEKLRQEAGRALYVSLSPYLVEHARNLYYAHHYENERQEVDFLSFAELLETLRVPEGRAVSFSAFARWFMRFPRAARVADAHAVYEEFRGVITGSPADRAFLSADEYLALGVRRSLFPAGERPAIYALFEKYLVFLKEQRLYDPNIVSHQYLDLVQPAYDFVVADEVQDITNIQLRLILKTLQEEGRFILCGDSNQIVHPNFFSWSSLKSMLYRSESADPGRVYQILHANFRNATAVTDLANRLLRIKHHRFGSVDRESTYLMEGMPDEPGEVAFLEDTPAVKTDLNRKTGLSTRFAVLVMREEDKAAAREFFRTPLLFSVQEAKGLEYENVILLNFISGERTNFADIAAGIALGDLAGDLAYGRGKDKSDKSLELYKFFINALYVAITRAVRRVYLVESDSTHPMARLLGFGAARDAAALAAQQSSREEWQSEARKLELQGKSEQAEEIRQRILQTTPVPWEVLNTERLLTLIDRALDSREVSQKPRKALLEYAVYTGETGLLEHLHRAGYDRAASFFRDSPIAPHRGSWSQYLVLDRERVTEQQRALAGRIHRNYEGPHFKGILVDCEKYGANHRNPFNQTPLMLAALRGNIKLAHALLDAGADISAIDNYGHTAWHLALGAALSDDACVAQNFPALHDMLVPSHLSIRVDDRLIKIDNHTGEFLLFALFLLDIHHLLTAPGLGISAVRLAKIMAKTPGAATPDHRRKRSYISSLLAKNEAESENPYNRKIFRRVTHGRYILNPKAEVKRGEDWITMPDLINLPLRERIAPKMAAGMIRILKGGPEPF